MENVTVIIIIAILFAWLISRGVKGGNDTTTNEYQYDKSIKESYTDSFRTLYDNYKKIPFTIEKEIIEHDSPDRLPPRGYKISDDEIQISIDTSTRKDDFLYWVLSKGMAEGKYYNYADSTCSFVLLKSNTSNDRAVGAFISNDKIGNSRLDKVFDVKVTDGKFKVSEEYFNLSWFKKDNSLTIDLYRYKNKNYRIRNITLVGG